MVLHWPSEIAATSNHSPLNSWLLEFEPPKILAFQNCSLPKLQSPALATSRIRVSPNHGLLNLQPFQIAASGTCTLSNLSLSKSQPSELAASWIQASSNCSPQNSQSPQIMASQTESPRNSSLPKLQPSKLTPFPSTLKEIFWDQQMGILKAMQRNSLMVTRWEMMMAICWVMMKEILKEIFWD